MIPVKLTVATDGHVSQVELADTSGNPKFDRAVQLHLLRVHYIPALTAEGVPFESIVQFNYKDVNEARTPRVVEGKVIPEQTEATASAPAPAARNDALFDEVGRIKRMRCQDFLWEYDIIKEASRGRPFYDEFSLRAIRAMYMVYRKGGGDHLNKLNAAFPSAVRAAADECRDQPEKMFFRDVMAPALDARLDTGSH